MPQHLPANGRLIRYYREQKKWTQMDLAVRAEVSERLIRKAESEGSVREESLVAIASALSSQVLTLHPSDLSSDPLAVAQAYMRGYIEHGAQSAKKCAHLFTPDVVMAIHTDAANLAFAGEFHGVKGIDQMIQNAYSQFNHIKKDFGRWSVDGQRVVAFCREDLQANGVADAPVFQTWILHEYTVTHGMISRIDNYIDSIAWSKYIEKDPANAALAR